MHELEGLMIGDKYQLQQFLDQGQFGQVFRGVHTTFGVEMRTVAIKIAKRPMELIEAQECFGDALMVAKVTQAADQIQGISEHFVHVYDAGICPEGTALAAKPYMVMEYVYGGSLKASLKVGPFPLTRARRYFDDILKAISFMHRGIEVIKGTKKVIVHRDLKPGNVLLQRTPHGRDIVKIADFGLAIEVDDLLNWCESGGELAYMAPESLSNNICSPKSDVYTLALIFYEMMTGKNPFAQVGNYLRGDDKEQQAELRRLHIDARQKETFSALTRDIELRKVPAVSNVIYQALCTDEKTRPFCDASEFYEAWMKAWDKRGCSESEVSPEKPWQRVKRLTGESEQRLAVGDTTKGMALLSQAMAINRDERLVPDHRVVGSAFYVYVDALIRQGEVEQAGRLAVEGYGRKKCRSTCQAMVRYYSCVNNHLAQRYREEARACRDQE